MTLGENIKKARRRCSLTQEQLAVEMALPTSAIAKWEDNTEKPGVYRLRLLAKVLNVSVDDLLESKEVTGRPVMDEINSLAQLGAEGKNTSRDRMNNAKNSDGETRVSAVEFGRQMTGEETMSDSNQTALSQDTEQRPQQFIDAAGTQGQPPQLPGIPGFVQGQPPQQPGIPGFVQEQPPQGYAHPMQNMSAPKRQRIRPNGKRYFSARTIVFPIVFLVLYFVIQMLGTALAGLSYFASDSFASLMDTSLDLADMIREMIKAIGVPALLYSTPVQILLFAIFLWYQKRKNPQYLLLRPNHASVFPLALGIAFGSLGLATLFILLFDMLAKFSPFWQNVMVTYQQSTEVLQGVDLLLTTLCVAILVPIAEELLFRGIIAEEIRQVAPDWLAILLSGVIFALVHGNLIQILYVLPLGFILGAAYIWTNTIWVPILIHVVFNFFGSIVSTQFADNETAVTVYTIFLLVMIPLGIICFVIINRMFRKDKKAAVGKPA
ncbi:MAG: CPBP family glutamic-type intramembrane protease [Bacillota bacterium]|nr:CPBP family glutamic-type intramembrane protease [Bacillota bacterium]